MRFPWQDREIRQSDGGDAETPESQPPKTAEPRQSGGGYTDAIVAAIEARASAKVADASATAAIEAAAGALSRAFMSAEVEGPGWVRDAVSPPWLAQVGRSLIREGASLSVIVMAGDGVVSLVPAAHWNFENVRAGGQTGERESTWRARVETYGPSTSYTRLLSRDRMIFVRWGTSPGERYRGRGPTSWAHLTARLQGEAERSLADESSGPLAQVIPLPQGPSEGEGDDTDPLTMLRADIAAARGKAVLVETTAAGFAEGQAAAPHKDWVANRLGPDPPESVVNLSAAAFDRMLAACGTPPALFLGRADGTAQREAQRRWHMNTVMPLARLLEHELTARLEVDVRLRFDTYAKDQVSRSTVFAKLMGAEGMTIDKALAIAGLLEGDD